MKTQLPDAIAQLVEKITSPQFVRAVLSGQRRNLQTQYLRIDIKPVLLKDGLKLQIVSSDGKKDFTKNVPQIFDFPNFFNFAYANW